MKKKLISLLFFGIIYTQLTFSQILGEVYFDGEGLNSEQKYPPTRIINGITYWCSYPLDSIISQSEFIFEGRILSDSVFIEKPNKYISHIILVTKKFKGNFHSDTIIVSTGGGGTVAIDGVFQDGSVYGKKGDEAIFCARSYGNLLHDLYGNGCGFVIVCDKKDVDMNLYKPLEKALGHPYIEVHPNTCAEQHKKPNK
jgi:hypothetical protein